MVKFESIEGATPLENMKQVAQLAVEIAENLQREVVAAKRVVEAGRALLQEIDLGDVGADFPDTPYDWEEPLREALKKYDELAR